MNTSTQEIQHAASLLQQGDVVALPTETVYGLAGNALDLVAVNKIFEVKNRPLIDPLIVHIADLEQLNKLANPHPMLEKLAEAFWPGALTLILPKTTKVPDLVTAGQPTVAIRMPSHPLFREVLKVSGLALAAPSANPFGYLSPSCAQHVQDSLGQKIPYVLDGGPCSIGIESTILDLSNKTPTVLRPGPITTDQLSTVLGVPVALKSKQVPEGEACTAPGLLKQHYSPHTPLTLLETGNPFPQEILQQDRIACIHLRRPHTCLPQDNIQHFWMSESGDLTEVAQQLFSLLRMLDTQGYTRLYLEMPQAQGIGVALRDRLQRAAARA